MKNQNFVAKLRVWAIAVNVAFWSAVLVGCAPYPNPIPCGDTDELIEAIKIANNTPATLDEIHLDTDCIYVVTNVYDNMPGNTGLPMIVSPIRIFGHGSIIQRDPAGDKFRLFYVGNFGDLELYDMTLENGFAIDPVHPNDVARNSGGAIRNTETLVVSNVIIQHNSADGVTGGIYNEGDLIVKGSTIHRNEQVANSYTMGGATALHNKMGSTMVIVASTISENGLNSGQWNAISNDETASVSIENSTISGNSGYGINNDGNLDLMYVTITGNVLGIWSVWYQIPKVNMTGVLFQNASDCFIGPGVLVSNYFNMDSDGSCNVMYTVPAASMGLGPLADNGGGTQTHKLLPGSPAIDAVTGPASRVCPIPEDQRGVSRPHLVFCDIGAYEYEGQLPPTPTFTPTATSTATPTPTATFTPTPEPAPSRCDLFDGDNATLTMFDIPYGTTDLTLYVHWPHPVWGLEEDVPGDEDPWEYAATLGSTAALECIYQGYAGRLYCSFELPESAFGASLVLNVYINGCDEPIFTHPNVSIFEPTTGCSPDMGEDACIEHGGTYTRAGSCTCP